MSMKDFSYLVGVFPEKIIQEVNEDPKVFHTKLVSELKSHQVKHYDIDIELESIKGSVLKLSNKSINLLIRNFERKSAYLTLEIKSTGPNASALHMKFRPNSVFTMLFFSHTTIGVITLVLSIKSDGIFHEFMLGPVMFIVGGLSMSIFGRISKKNLHASVMRVINKVNKNH